MGINASKEHDPLETISAIPTKQSNRFNRPIIDESKSNVGNLQTAITETDNNDDVVPTVFKWEHGGRNVFLTGTFNNWERQLPMHKSGNDFTYVHNLKRGKHAFKFIVDDEWRFAPDQPTIADVEGHINNFIDVTEFIPYVGDEKFFERSKGTTVYIV
jgi:hypothetical protein